MRDLVVTGLPQIAQAFKQSFGTINYTQYAGSPDGNPMAMIGSALEQVLHVAKGFGLDASKLGAPAQAAARTQDAVPTGGRSENE